MPRGMGRGRGAVEKPKDFGGVMKKLVKFCSRYIPVMIFALVLGAAGTVCQIIGPDKLKDMTNEITKGLPAMVHGKPVMNSIDMDAVSRIAWLLVALYVGYALLSYLQSWLMANVTQRTAQQLREAISQKINRLPLKYFDKVSYGDVLSRITNDVDAIGQTLGQSVGSLITSITLFFGALIMMFYNNVTMTLCAIGSALLGLIIMGVIMKVSQKYFTRQQVALGDVNGHVEEMYTGHTVVKAYCGEERSIEQFEKYNNDLYVSGWKSQFLSGLMMPIMNFVGNFGYVVVCVVGAVLAMDGKIEFGVIVAFMMYIRLFTQPLSQFAQAFQNLQRCAAASERLRTATNDWNTLLNGSAADAAKTDRKSVKDAKMLDALSKTMKATIPKTVSCKADSRTGVQEAAKAITANAAWYKTHAKTLSKAVKAVESSKLDKTVDDAQALYDATSGKVQDDKTRASLLDAIKKRDADAIGKAVKTVNESKAAKEKADAEAKAKAEQEAAAAAAAQQQAQASQSQSAPQRQTPSYSQGSSGSGSGSGRRPSSGGSSSSANTGGASPGWSVPTPSDGGTGLPGSDPGL